MTKKILGIDITISLKSDILEEIEKYLQKAKNEKRKTKSEKLQPLMIFTPNPEIITYAQKNKDFIQIVNSAQINLPDSFGIVWAIKKIYGIIQEKISGADFIFDLVSLSEKKGFTVGLIGGRGGVADDALECLQKEYPKLKGWVVDRPEVVLEKKYIGVSIKYIGNEKNHVLNTRYLSLNTEGKQDNKTEEYFQNLTKEIVEKKIDILFVGLGFPKQEYFIKVLSSQFSVLSSSPLVLMAVGGSFDYIAGRVKRAPEWMRNRGWEWLYRLIKEPWRILRQLKGAEFFLRVLAENQ